MKRTPAHLDKWDLEWVYCRLVMQKASQQSSKQCIYIKILISCLNDLPRNGRKKELAKKIPLFSLEVESRLLSAMKWTSSNLLTSCVEQKGGGKLSSALCFSKDILPLLLPFDIDSPCSWASELKHILIQLPSVLRLYDSDWDLHTGSPGSQAFGFGLSLQFAEYRSWHFSASIIVWASLS